jgi:hypothetical protein
MGTKAPTPNLDEGSDVERPGGNNDGTFMTDPADILRMDLTDELDFDDNIYGAASAACCFVPLTSNRTLRAVGVGVGFVTAINFALQAYLIAIIKMYISSPAVMKIRQIYTRYHAEVFPNGTFVDALFTQLPAHEKQEVCEIALAHPTFFLVFLFVWTSWSGIQMRYAVKKILAIFSLARCTETDVRISSNIVENDEFGKSKEVEKLLVVGVSSRIKFIIIGLIRGPELLLAVLLWWVGCRWLTATNNFQDMILNAVALAFVSEIDEMVYHLLMPDLMKVCTNMIKVRISKSADLDRELIKSVLWMIFTAAVVALLCFGYYHFQHVLPGYRYDIHQACTAHIQEWNTGSLWSM